MGGAVTVLAAPAGGEQSDRPGQGSSAGGVTLMRKRERLDVSEVGDVTVIRFRDQRITEDRPVREIAEELLDLVQGNNCKKMLVSLSSVDFLSSSALGKLIMLDKKAKARGSVLKLSNICPRLLQVFSVSKLDRLFDIEKDESQALAAF
jgi:anti-anti-sigma factor